MITWPVLTLFLCKMLLAPEKYEIFGQKRPLLFLYPLKLIICVLVLKKNQINHHHHPYLDDNI